MKKIILAVLLLFTSLCLLSGCSKKEVPLGEQLVFSFDNNNIYMDEMIYHIMISEIQGELYTSYVGSDFWTTKDENGTLMADSMKDATLENAIYYELFYTLAQGEGYELTKEEKTTAASNAQEIMMSMDDNKKQITSLTEESLTTIQEKILLADRYCSDYKEKNNLSDDSEAFTAAYNNLKAEHNIKVNDNIWKTVKLGSVTI